MKTIIYTFLCSAFLLLAIPSLSLSQSDVIGKVIYAKGTVNASSSSKTLRPLKRRSRVYEKEMISTKDDSKAEVRLTDNTLVSLQPNTDYQLNEYTYDSKNPDNNKNVSTLIKGGLRTVTGLIAKKTPKHFKIKTSVAVIGVRGTDFRLLLKDKKLFVKAYSGVVAVTTKAGTITIGDGQQHKCASVASGAAPAGADAIPAK